MHVIIVIIAILSCIIVMREFPLSHSPSTNNIAIPLIFSQVISTYRPMTDIYLSVLWLVISDISQYKTL